MFLTVWNYLRGYVIIEVSGFSVERFINLATHRSIYLWDVSRGVDLVTMKVSVKAFKLLKPCAKKTKCKIKIIGKQGAPFITYRYRRRKFLGLGVLFFVFALYFLSSFIWLVDLTGNERLKNETLLSFLSDKKLKPGVFKNTVDRKVLEKALRDNFSDISWVNIEMKGTKATVQLTETIPHKEILDNSVPCDIIAKKDGLITGIATSAGTPKVKPGDVVKEGDVLVSGMLLIGDETTGGAKAEFVHAKSEVRAKMYYKINFEVPFDYTEKRFTGNIEQKYSIILFDKKFDILRKEPSYVNYEKVTANKQISFGENYPLPVLIVTDKYREFLPEKVTRTLEQAERYGDELITNRVIREFDMESDIVDKKVNVTEVETGIKVEAFITTIERIDLIKTIDPSEILKPVEPLKPGETSKPMQTPAQTPKP